MSERELKKEVATMRLNPPTKNVFYLSAVLVVVGLVAQIITIPFLSSVAFWIVFVGYVLLFLGNTMKGF
ncbi:MAG: hypothetical protein PVF85_04825 [Anaerolineales bacterium]|jgi:hypothetical protein